MPGSDTGLPATPAAELVPSNPQVLPPPAQGPSRADRWAWLLVRAVGTGGAGQAPPREAQSAAPRNPWSSRGRHPQRPPACAVPFVGRPDARRAALHAEHVDGGLGGAEEPAEAQEGADDHGRRRSPVLGQTRAAEAASRAAPAHRPGGSRAPRSLLRGVRSKKEGRAAPRRPGSWGWGPGCRRQGRTWSSWTPRRQASPSSMRAGTCAPSPPARPPPAPALPDALGFAPVGSVLSTPRSLPLPAGPRAHHAVHHAHVLVVLPQPRVHAPADAVQTVEVGGPPGRPAALGDLRGDGLAQHGPPAGPSWAGIPAAAPSAPTPPVPPRCRVCARHGLPALLGAAARSFWKVRGPGRPLGSSQGRCGGTWSPTLRRRSPGRARCRRAGTSKAGGGPARRQARGEAAAAAHPVVELGRPVRPRGQVVDRVVAGVLGVQERPHVLYVVFDGRLHPFGRERHHCQGAAPVSRLGDHRPRGASAPPPAAAAGSGRTAGHTQAQLLGPHPLVAGD